MKLKGRDNQGIEDRGVGKEMEGEMEKEKFMKI